ncbi:MAG: hypothetical protein WBA00_12760 [Rhodococcus sp. (in: high G+C Gram-positive bacteria)]
MTEIRPTPLPPDWVHAAEMSTGRYGRTMRRWGRSIASAIVIVGVMGVIGWPAPRPPAAPLSEPTCVGYLHGVPAGAILDPQHDTGSRPPGFDTVAVVRCEPAEALIVDQEVTRVRMTTFTGDVAAVQAAFDRRSPKVTFDRFFFCSGDYPVPVVAVWLVNDDGLGYRPALPRTRCGRTDFTALDTTEGLTVVDAVVITAQPHE